MDKKLTKVHAAIAELKEGMNLNLDDQEKFVDVNSQLDVLTERMNNMEKNSEDRITKLELASVKYSERIQSIKSLLESVNDKVQQNELHHQQKMEQMAVNMQEMRTKMVSMGQKMKTLYYKKIEELNCLKAETYEWKIKDVAKTILEDKWKFESEAFNFTGYQYEIRAKLEKYDGDAFVGLQFKEGNAINKFLNKNGFTTVHYIVEDQSNVPKKQHLIRESHLRYSDCYGQSGWIFGYILPGSVFSSPYTKDDCITITMLFLQPSIDRSFISNNGVLKWKLDNYEAKKREQLYCTWSPSFYTSPRGFRVKTEFDINNKGSMYVAVIFLTGEHDESPSMDFPHRTTVTLFNQSDPSKNLVKCDLRKDVKPYAIRLESITFIEENDFVKDDSLICSVVIEHVISRIVK